MNSWNAPLRPSAYAEHMLIEAILGGTFPPGSSLPGERTLAAQLGVTRPTLREALQRLARDGWLTVQQGKATAVNDYWREGGLNVLSALVQHSDRLPPGFVTQLLQVRLQLAPAYTRAAVEHQAQTVVALLQTRSSLPDDARSFAAFDWQLQRQLTIASTNPIYTMILNGFADFYEKLAGFYFLPEASRAASRRFYRELAAAAAAADAAQAERVSVAAMRESIALWERTRRNGGMGTAAAPRTEG